MNSTQAREIPIEKVLEKQGYFPSKKIKNCYWYLSPFRAEKTPSFKLDLRLNRWFDHGEQIGGNTIDFIVYKFNFSVSEALTYLKNFTNNIDSFSFQKQNFEVLPKEQQVINQIEKIMLIQHPALIQYLKSRNIIHYKNIEQLKEIHYIIGDKKYFGLGFLNNSDGWEIRSKYAKICIAKKDITTISIQSKTLRIFEGFFDYLSFIQLQKKLSIAESDYLILNSVALITKNLSILENYKWIEVYLDNDATGDKYANIILDHFPTSSDNRNTFNGFKDLNDWYMKME